MAPASRLQLNFIVAALLLIASVHAFATDGVSTFASFYQQDTGISWIWAGVAAAVVGVLVFIGWPILGPAMASTIGSIGTAIGGVLGYSGAVATNVGLALLGGGAIASGGFGVIGGTALLAAAITFSTDVSVDYALGALANKYDAAKFEEDSLTMMTLPLPTNFSGPGTVKAAAKALDSSPVSGATICVKVHGNSVDGFKKCMTAMQKTQRQLIRQALAAMVVNKAPLDGKEAERQNAMYALLHFLNNDYVLAKRYAYRAHRQGTQFGNTPTLPAYIYSVALLADKKPNLNVSIAMFQYAVTMEPDNPLTPVLFATLLDRLSYRMNDGSVGVDAIERLSRFARTLPGDFRKLVIQQSLLSHDLMQLKLAQQRVLSLTRTTNATIRENPRTLSVVQASAKDYASLLKTANALVARQRILIRTLTRDKSWWNKVKDGQNPFSDGKATLNSIGWYHSMSKINAALKGYQGAQKDLEDRVAGFEKDLSTPKPVAPAPAPVEDKSWSFLRWIKSPFK